MKTRTIVPMLVSALLIVAASAPAVAQERQGTQTQTRQQLKDPAADSASMKQYQKRYQKKSQQGDSQGTGTQSRKGNRNKGG